jgi:hypothetical protein
MKIKHCCEQMKQQMELECPDHGRSCPDILIRYIDIFDEYGLNIFDGGNSYIVINFCPWCGRKLPESQRDNWFLKLEELGFNDPFEDDIPEIFKSGAWRR